MSGLNYVFRTPGQFYYIYYINHKQWDLTIAQAALKFLGLTNHPPSPVCDYQSGWVYQCVTPCLA